MTCHMTWSPPPSVVTVGVAEPGYSVEEGAGSVTVCVTKTGEASFGITGRLTSVESAGDLATGSSNKWLAAVCV